MKIFICENYREMSVKAADIVAKAAHGKKVNLGLATGSTPEGMYARLIELCREGKCDFSETVTFNLDEYYPIEPENPQSYRYYMDEKFFNHVNINKNKTHVPAGNAASPEEVCHNYEKLMAEEGGIDLQVIGVGPNGHIGFNEPGEELFPLTHLTGLTETTIEANSRFFKSKDAVPKSAITMGMKSILSARSILVLASGKSKHNAIKKLLEGKITTKWPLTFLNLHPDVIIICDKEAMYG